MLSSTATTTIDRDETEELGKALGLDFALTFLFLPRPFASASKPAEEDPPEKVLLDAKKTGSDLIKKEFDEEGKVSDGMSGMRLSYFGARYYDSEIGVWTGVDPEGQFVYGYGYCDGNPIILVDPDGRWVGQLIGQMVLGASMSTAQYAISSGGNITGKGLLYSAIGGAIGGAASYGSSYLLGNVLTLPAGANAVLEPVMRGTSTFLADALAQQIAYGKVNWGQALIKGGVQTAYSAVNVAMNGALINPMRDFRSVESEMNSRLSAGHEKYNGGNGQVDISQDTYQHRIGGIKANIRFGSGQEREEGRAYPNRTYTGGNTSQVNSRYLWRGDYRGTYLHEIYHTYTTLDNEVECDAFSAAILQKLGAF